LALGFALTNIRHCESVFYDRTMSQ
jgi:hypothetical protein